MEPIKISVRRLIEFAQRSGDIDTSFTNLYDRAKEGTLIHQKVQKSYDSSYQKEVKLIHTQWYRDFQFTVEGRADGIQYLEQRYLVDEIKSTTRDLDSLSYNSNISHWAQVQCYGYFYAVQKEIETIDLQLTYYHVETDQIKKIKETFKIEDLKEFYLDLLDKYLVFSDMIATHKTLRDHSIESFQFPYMTFRKGQRKLAVAVYNTIKEEKSLLAEAPTGVGKTISTLFPAIKSIPLNTDKIMYLTAKSTTKYQCQEQIVLLLQKNLFLKSVTLTSKEKICLTGDCKCNPEDCPFAKGHYDRVNEAILDIFEQESLMIEEVIVKYSKKHKVCPVEFQFDLANFSDVIIADYNYAFDPVVYLRRFFDDSLERITLLVDESHNLVSRGREMFTYSLQRDMIEGCIDSLDEKHHRIKKSLLEIIKELNNPTLQKVNRTLPTTLLDTLIQVMRKIRKYLVDQKKDPSYEKMLELYFEFSHFLKISDFFDDSFRLIRYQEEKDCVSLKMMCLDTSHVFKNTMKNVHSSVFFSATLSPFLFYKKLFGVDDAYTIRVESPFDPENLKIHILPLSMRFKDRIKNRITLEKILRHLYPMTGNKLVFFPSYGFMHQISEMMPNEIRTQKIGSTENERIDFLRDLTDTSNIMAFAVLGGVYSEGIDLIGDRLNTVILVSVGLPKVNFENNLIKEYFDALGEDGFMYAYGYPGMNKIAQAGGRVIRDKSDRGHIFLIDDRFLNARYKNLLPHHWKNIEVVTDITTIRNLQRSKP